MFSLPFKVWCSGGRHVGFDLGEPRAPQAQILSMGTVAWPLGLGRAGRCYILALGDLCEGPMPETKNFIPRSPWERSRTNLPSSCLEL